MSQNNQAVIIEQKNHELVQVAQETKNIYQAMALVMEEIEAIGKDKTQKGYNKDTGFNYRGIDDVYNTLHPILSKHGIFTTPEALEQTRTERVNSKGTVMFYTSIHMKYTFWCKDGSGVSCIVFGEAMDSGDKSTAKAMSIAHKYALLQTFSIPTVELIDQEMDVYDNIQPELTGYEESIKSANTIDELAEAWKTIPKNLLATLAPLKDERKQELINATANGGMAQSTTSESNSQ